MNSTKNMNGFFLMIGVSVALVALMPGCTTTDNSRSSVQENENFLLLREDVNRCNDRLKTMEIEQQRIMNEVQQLRAQGQDENTKLKLDELERRVAALDAARASDRQAIIDQLSGNVAKMMGATSSPKTTTPPKTTKPSSAVSSTGYEHIVKDGETLSAIATAYKVKSSAIIEANDLKNPNALRKGQKLFIPQQ